MGYRRLCTYEFPKVRRRTRCTSSVVDDQNTPGRSRTGDQQFRKLLLYPTELRGQKRKIAYPAGVRHPQRKTSVTESIKCLVLHDCVKLQAVERGTTI